MPSTYRDDERRFPILVLKIKVTASSNKLFCDGRMAVLGSEVQRSGPTCSLLVVDEGLRACRRQQRRNSPCISTTRSMEELHILSTNRSMEEFHHSWF
jgi:hypothetical protein